MSHSKFLFILIPVIIAGIFGLTLMLTSDQKGVDALNDKGNTLMHLGKYQEAIV